MLLGEQPLPDIVVFGHGRHDRVYKTVDKLE
jgi:hypothetical protein